MERNDNNDNDEDEFDEKEFYSELKPKKNIAPGYILYLSSIFFYISYHFNSCSDI